MIARPHSYYAKVACAKLYDRKTPLAAAALINDRVVPLHKIVVSRVFTDRGTEFSASRSGTSTSFTSPSRTLITRAPRRGARRPMVSVNASTRRLLDEFYRVAFRKKLYRRIDELQADLDAWLVEYNEQSPPKRLFMDPELTWCRTATRVGNHGNIPFSLTDLPFLVDAHRAAQASFGRM
jgi:hypothetical protein